MYKYTFFIQIFEQMARFLVAKNEAFAQKIYRKKFFAIFFIMSDLSGSLTVALLS